MKEYQHIEKMEKIRVQQEENLKQLEQILETIEKGKKDYDSLIEYYYSEQRMQDIEDEKKNSIPKTMQRGVLSEDEIYNLMGDYHEISIRMMEIALKFLK